ncbi:hypothetical protein V7075_07805 [Neobacillus drentensis]|jgi:hypothetical protein|uniref:hypothetical protein n=1 Tax=Neobacillus drentensis TaxID=220684 RepID=UPI002FFDB906
MLAKINELNKNAVILISVGIIAVTSIVLTLILTGEQSGKGNADSIVEFQKYVEEEYGVKPNVSINIEVGSESKAKMVSDGLTKQLGLEEPMELDIANEKWLSSFSGDESIRVGAYYEE